MMERRTIRELRRLAGWSQIELAAKIGVSKMSISHWETGRNEPSARQLRALAQAFAIPMESIRFEKEAVRERQEEDEL
jgi:transcriptional regulator with XRE-family HTH domain